MAVPAFFEALQASSLGLGISGSTWIFPTIETIHVFALTTVVGTIAVVDLRLLGLAFKEKPVTAVSQEYLPWTWGAFGVAVISGLLLFVSRAADYLTIAPFLIKFVFMGLAGLNMAVFHLLTWRSVETWDQGPPASGAKLAGLVSLAFWAVVIVLGRKVGFSL